MNIKALQQRGKNLTVSKDKSTAYNTDWAQEATSSSTQSSCNLQRTSPSPCRIYLQSDTSSAVALFEAVTVVLWTLQGVLACYAVKTDK
jgi:hypothetical protein